MEHYVTFRELNVYVGGIDKESVILDSTFSKDEIKEKLKYALGVLETGKLNGSYSHINLVFDYPHGRFGFYIGMHNSISIKIQKFDLCVVYPPTEILTYLENSVDVKSLMNASDSQSLELIDMLLVSLKRISKKQISSEDIKSISLKLMETTSDKDLVIISEKNYRYHQYAPCYYNNDDITSAVGTMTDFNHYIITKVGSPNTRYEIDVETYGGSSLRITSMPDKLSLEFKHDEINESKCVTRPFVYELGLETHFPELLSIINRTIPHVSEIISYVC